MMRQGPPNGSRSSLQQRKRPFSVRCSTTAIVKVLTTVGVLAVSVSVLLTFHLHHYSTTEGYRNAGQSSPMIGGESRWLAHTTSSSSSSNEANHHDDGDGATRQRIEQLPLLSPMTNASSSACMLIMDDNHWLVEWLAYHYTTINLRHMIIAIDERSRTSPIEILDRYKGRIEFELWNDTHYFRDAKPDDDNLQSINLARQQTFLAKCMQTFKKQRPQTAWTMFIDTDEFIVINRRTKRNSSSLYRDYVPPLDQPGSILAFLEREQQLHSDKICHSMGRLQFAPDESGAAQIQRNVPAILNASHFLTLRWLVAAADLIGPKNLVDLSVVDASAIPAASTYQHQVLPQYCGDIGSAWHRQNSLLQIYHYMGTLEQFNFRDDARWSSQGKHKGRNGRYTRYAGEFVEYADDLRPWIKGFVELVGEQEAVRLLEGVGRTTNWPSAAAHADRFADLGSVPSDWPPGGARSVDAGVVGMEEDADDDNGDDEEVDEEKDGESASLDGDGQSEEDTEGRDTVSADGDEDQSEEDKDDDKAASGDDEIDQDSDKALETEEDTRDGLAPGSKFYSHARADRSGAAIADMLLAHAYGYAHNLRYGGACGAAHDEHKQETLNLIKTIGMDDILQFACPDASSESPIVDRKIYFAEKATLWNDNYLAMLHSKIQYSEPEYSVALHVRRGDVSPCGKYANRYLPNAHYLDILRQYNLTDESVVVFSESDAFESFDDFRARNYAVELDSPLEQVWKTIMTANFVILAKSSFSFVPAMLNPRGTIIYTPFLHPSLPGWRTVDTAILARTREAMERFQATCDQR